MPKGSAEYPLPPVARSGLVRPLLLKCDSIKDGPQNFLGASPRPQTPGREEPRAPDPPIREAGGCPGRARF